MAERLKAPPGAGVPVLQISGLNVFYGRSHALQGVDLTLQHGVLSVVGRNGMGKTTMCKAIMGLVPASSGSIRLFGEEIAGRAPADIARLGIGYVPQGRRLWRSLTVDEHLRLMQRGKRGAWTPERIYAAFPRLAERRNNGGAQLSGGEQQMLAISRALLLNPRLLIMDEPTEGLAPVIVAHVEEMLVRLAEQGDVAILVIEQNIGVATQMSDPVAIMVNGRINRIIASATLAGDRDLQQRLLGVGRHGHDETDGAPEDLPGAAAAADRTAAPTGPTRVFVSNPALPTRWSQPVPAARIEAQARTISRPTLATRDGHALGAVRPLAAAAAGDPYVMIAGTLDTKGEELRFLRDLIRAEGLRTRLVDLSTSGRSAGGDVSPNEVALAHPKGSAGLSSGDRGTAVAAMTEAFAAWLPRQTGLLGIISAGGSGATAMVTPAMQALPVGLPKVMISTLAGGDMRAYVGASDVIMMPAVTDVQGLNRVSRLILGNGARALAAMAKARLADLSRPAPARGGPAAEKPLVGLTMFGVTTPCVQQVCALLRDEWEPLVFHATGTGGRALEKLVESGLVGAVIDVSTTEICDMMMGGLLPATQDRLGAVIRTRIPYVGSVGALDMVNFAAPDTVPERYRGRIFYPHNPQITLMRTTPEENARMGRWLGERLNLMEGPVRFLLPEAGVSALDARGQPFHDPAADAALFEALAQTVRTTPNRQLVRLPHHINDPAFAASLVQHFRALHAGRRRERTAQR
ncbi:ABC transporter permease [Aquabacter spiritensis]|uniref:Amino acid/amide ABC transporter ATP-binding protein 2 (HAAT family) n=1 Tax=Aquabacter spiritensis TaxID=933073 RepID=A0A4R3LWP3_9HYPH|nr:ABC transporter permease [Aquabacter spiritensis]TCT05051.1 amino acid/amide ABC transporter ATP-binding protein 2 (HAAT family) [Aquabacter spiritensis]